VRMRAATFESFLTTAILSRIQMGKRSSIEIARYARTLISCCRIVVLADMIWATNLMCYRKKGPALAIVYYNTTLRRHIESAHRVCCQRLRSEILI
jgi:hypothetical protein